MQAVTEKTESAVPFPVRRRPSVELLLLALPMIAQFSSYVVMQFTDTYMLSLVGDLEATAAGQAGSIVWSIVAFGFGTLLIVNTLASQSYGRKDPAACGRYLWQGLWFAVGYGALAMLALPLARPAFDAFGHEPALAALEASYFQICLSFVIVKLAGTATSQFLTAINRPNVVMLGTFAGVAANIGANWVLIFGNLGFPKLGLVGAAWGTNIAILVEVLVFWGYILLSDVRREYHALDLRPRGPLFRTLLRVGAPSGLSTVAEVAAWSMFLVVAVGLFGTTVMTAQNYAFRFMMVSFMPAVGIGQAVTALVGRYIGAGEPEQAARRAHLGFAMVSVYMVSCGVLMVVFRHDLMRLFTVDEQVVAIGGSVLIMMALYQFFDAMYVVYHGALRGAGDTLVPAIVLAVLVWTICVGGSFVVAKTLPEYGVVGPWAITTVYGLLLGAFLMARFSVGRWKSIRLHPGHDPASMPRASSDRVPGLELIAEQP
jgi:MATE family multidrug resistance protein